MDWKMPVLKKRYRAVDVMYFNYVRGRQKSLEDPEGVCEL